MDRLEDVQRLEAGDDERLAVVVGDEAIDLGADDGGDVARPDEAVQSQLGESRIAVIGGTIVTWLENTEKLRTPSAFARVRVTAVDGAVVSNPTAKKTTSRSGLSTAILSASSGE